MSESLVKEKRLVNLNQCFTDINIANVNRYGMKQEIKTNTEEGEKYYHEVLQTSVRPDVEIKIKGSVNPDFLYF